MSKLDHMLEPETASVHRLEVISGTGRRRRFSDEFRARVVEETLAPDAVVSQIARRHGLTPQQVFTWRRQAREVSGESAVGAPVFVPALIEDRPASGSAGARRSDAIIEIEIGGSIVRVGRGVDADTVAAVIAALQRAK
jgi:transposase